MLDLTDRSLYIADELAPISALQLADLSLMIKDGVLENLLDIFVANLGWLFAW